MAATGDMQSEIIANALGKELQKAVKIAESKLDKELADLDRLESQPGDHDDELERIRTRRLAEMKRSRDQVDEWRARGHGALVEVPLGDARAEKGFFDEARGSHHLVAFFYKDLSNSPESKVLRSHLSTIATRHLEAKFLSVDGGNCPFLCTRLKLSTFPVVLCFEAGKVKTRITANQLLRTEPPSSETPSPSLDPLPAEALEYLLARAGVVRGDTSAPSAAVRRALPDLFASESAGGTSSVLGYKKKSGGANSGGHIIRDGLRTDDDGDDDWS